MTGERLGLGGQPRNDVTRSRSINRSVLTGSGIASVTSVAPAISTLSNPVPNPPTQKNGIGTYSRVSVSMRRADNPARTAAKALPANESRPWAVHCYPR